MEQEYTIRLNKIESELKYWLPDMPDSAWIEKVFGKTGEKIDIAAVNNLLAPVKELIFRGGKRWRPLLMSLVCETLNGGDAAVPLAPVVEFSHNASLIHDDIEDESDERRGKPSIHKTFGIDTAINAGSFFYFLASSCIDSCNLKDKGLIYQIWMECMRRLHLGQSMDINWHRNASVIPSIEDYCLMCAMKTGSLARLAAGLGVLAAGAPKEAALLFGGAADKMGIGFQILDDVKNLTTGIPGKKRGDDVVEGKKSLPILLYLKKYPEKRERIFYFFHMAKTEGSSAPEVEELIEILLSAGVFEEAGEIGKSYLKETKEMFNFREFEKLISGNYTINEKSHALLDNFINLIS